MAAPETSPQTAVSSPGLHPWGPWVATSPLGLRSCCFNVRPCQLPDPGSPGVHDCAWGSCVAIPKLVCGDLFPVGCSLESKLPEARTLPPGHPCLAQSPPTQASSRVWALSACWQFQADLTAAGTHGHDSHHGGLLHLFWSLTCVTDVAWRPEGLEEGMCRGSSDLLREAGTSAWPLPLGFLYWLQPS